MQLTKEQILYIEDYIKGFDIKYYEIYMEILDHMILSVEAILEQNKEIVFEDAVLKAKIEGFGKKSFKALVKERKEFLNKKNARNYGKAIKYFFSFPKILFTISVFFGFYLFIGVFESSKKVTLCGILCLLAIAFSQLYYWYKYRKIEQFKLIKNHFYAYGINSVSMWMYFINFIDNDSEYLNHYSVKLFFTVCFVMSLFSLLIFIEVRKKTIEELQTQIFV